MGVKSYYMNSHIPLGLVKIEKLESLKIKYSEYTESFATALA
jgi:hypothetical protein